MVDEACVMRWHRFQKRIEDLESELKTANDKVEGVQPATRAIGHRDGGGWHGVTASGLKMTSS